MGAHRGYWFHTIGQRKGLGLSGGPWFVVRKDTDENVIYVSRGYDTELQYGHEFGMQDFHFITENPWEGVKEAIPVTFKIRHTPEFIRGKLLRDETGCLIVSEEKLQGIAPGQFGVVYDEAAKLVSEAGKSDIVLHQIHNARFHSIFRSFVSVVHTQFSEDILPVAVHGMETEVSFGCYFFGSFS